MANVVWSNFTVSSSPLLSEFAVGYATAVPGGERRWTWANVQTLILAPLGTAAYVNVTTFDLAGAAANAVANVTKASIGLGAVENTALSTWPGSVNLTTLGTVSTGTWQANPIADAYIVSAANWNAKEPALPSGNVNVWLRGDKTMQNMNATVVGLGNVVNTSNSAKRIIGCSIDGGGSAVTTGVKGYVRFPWAATITKVTLLGDVTGNAVVDIWKTTYASYPPVAANTITANARPTLSSALKYEDSTLTGWTINVAGGDTFGFSVNSAANVTRLMLELEATLT